VLGLLVIPAWVLTLVADERQIKARGSRLIAPAARPDVHALFRIVDRALSTFLRIRVLLAVVAGVLIWAGLTIARELGIADFPFAVTGATLLGLLQLVPELGFFLGFFPILLVLVIGGPIPALTTAVVYVLAVRIASGLIETRVSRGVLDVHPGLLIPAIVVLSQFGPLWFLAAAPAVAIARDLVRYAAGRLADPPAPAGVLPGERRPTASSAMAAVPTVYRARAARLAAAAAAPATAPTAAPVTARPSAATVTQRSAQS
jgi:predicted PurR-regulated permease PerM